ncbi:hypothetical protein H696_01127 [Fonticula alba]|uniref:RGS domain-containing protein n=1 Tax=Fonticula alba TaxID=691883 RepID=A0A058ZBC8_FONAL|nr:hypothetical protein H696_01127 [Fonticula alba]KCV71704.1 hypothetical protein H696_01127 [Fonticula alba]|eukprot:XP_009493282.1 hypothetical protein H696_01127 [Fonticula alba]
MLTALFLTIDVSFSDFDTSLDTCIYGAMYVVILEIIIFVPLIAGCVFLVWSSRDVYRIKQELLINTSTSFVLAVLWGTAAVSGAAGWFRADIIAIFLTAFNNLLIVIFPVVLSYLPFYKRLTRNRMHLNPDIEGHLESGRSKTGLFDFETFRHFPGPAMHFEHFCIESWCAEIHLFHTRSLRFLDNYKRMTPMQRYDEVLDMRDQFIMTNSPFEINIPGHVRQKLLQTFKEVADLDENGKPRDIPRDIFLPAHRETGEQLDRLLNIWRDTPIGQRETRDLPLM